MELERSSLIFLYDSWEALKFIQDVSVMFASLVCKRNHFCGSFKPLKFNKIIKYRQNRCLCDFHTLESMSTKINVGVVFIPLQFTRLSEIWTHITENTVALRYTARPEAHRRWLLRLCTSCWKAACNAAFCCNLTLKKRFPRTLHSYKHTLPHVVSIVLQTRLKNTSIIHDTTTTPNSHLYNCNGSWRRNQAR